MDFKQTVLTVETEALLWNIRLIAAVFVSYIAAYVMLHSPFEVVPHQFSCEPGSKRIILYY